MSVEAQMVPKRFILYFVLAFIYENAHEERHIQGNTQIFRSTAYMQYITLNEKDQGSRM